MTTRQLLPEFLLRPHRRVHLRVFKYPHNCSHPSVTTPQFRYLFLRPRVPQVLPVFRTTVDSWVFWLISLLMDLFEKITHLVYVLLQGVCVCQELTRRAYLNCTLRAPALHSSCKRSNLAAWDYRYLESFELSGIIDSRNWITVREN